MSIDVIEAIVKMDDGYLNVNKPAMEKHFECKLCCRFGTLRHTCLHIPEGLNALAKMYQTLEMGSVDETLKGSSYVK